jgi:serine/threonine protein kinase
MEPTPSKPVRFGKYRLIRKIGSGGMAEVYKATYAQDQTRAIAIKKILTDLSRDKKLASMIVNEAKLAMMLSHQNIVPIYDFGLVDNHYFIAMEYIEGKDLRSFLKKAYVEGKILPLEITLQVIVCVLEGLYYAHTKRDNFNKPLEIVHRDISPQNIFVSYSGDVKVLDFGIAKAKGSLSDTQAGILKGKFSYMSPEQARGKDIDQRSDIFSAGIVFHELLTTRSLFGDQSEIRIIEKVRKAKVSNPSSINPDIPKPLAKIVMKALSKWKFRRYQNAWDFKEDILTWSYKNGMMLSKDIVRDFIAQEFPRRSGEENEPVESFTEEEMSVTDPEKGATKTDLKSPSIAKLIEDELQDVPPPPPSQEQRQTVVEPPSGLPSFATEESESAPTFKPRRNLFSYLNPTLIVLLLMLSLAIFAFTKRNRIKPDHKILEKIHRYTILVPREKIHGFTESQEAEKPSLSFKPVEMLNDSPQIYFAEQPYRRALKMSLEEHDGMIELLQRILKGQKLDTKFDCATPDKAYRCVLYRGSRIAYSTDKVFGHITVHLIN